MATTACNTFNTARRAIYCTERRFSCSTACRVGEQPNGIVGYHRHSFIHVDSDQEEHGGVRVPVAGVPRPVLVRVLVASCSHIRFAVYTLGCIPPVRVSLPRSSGMEWCKVCVEEGISLPRLSMECCEGCVEGRLCAG